VAGTLAYVGLAVAGYPAAAGGAFLLTGALAVGYHRRSGALFDERDDEVLATASANTMATLGIASALFFPGMAVLTALDVLTWPAWLTPVGLFVGALYAPWIGQVALARARR
jgi:hypothetical protein